MQPGPHKYDDYLQLNVRSPVLELANQISTGIFVTSLGEHIFEVNLFGNYYGERLPQKDTESWNSFPDDPRIKIFEKNPVFYNKVR